MQGFDATVEAFAYDPVGNRVLVYGGGVCPDTVNGFSNDCSIGFVSAVRAVAPCAVVRATR